MNAKRWLYLGTIAALLALGMLGGCSRSRNDAQIAGEVVTKINSDANLPNKQIAVTASKGVVTLSGAVGSELERSAAANDAAQVEGVRTVVNNLQVAAPVSASAAAPTTATEHPAAEPVRAKPSSRTYARRKPSASVASEPAAPAVTAVAPTPVAAPAPPKIPEPPKPVTIPEGTILSVRMIDAVDSDHNQPGDTFRATLDSPITLDDKVVVPQGADIQGRVAELKSSGRFSGRSAIALELASMSMNGRHYTLHTNQYSREGTSRGKRTAATVGGGAAVGAIIGGIAGGGKGAVIGATVGAGAGTGVTAATKGQQIHVPSEALLTFRLENQITVTPVASINRGSVPRVNEPDDTQNDARAQDDPDVPVLKRRDQ